MNHSEHLRAAAAASGDTARSLKESPGFRDAMARLEQAYIDAWRTSTPDQTDIRDQAYVRLCALREFATDLDVQMSAARLIATNHFSKLKA